LPSFNAVIIEHKPQVFDEGGATGRYSDKHQFHFFGSSFDLLEEAIIFAIARHNEVCSDFARAACHLLKKDYR
jgi:hypothetical protein